MITLTASEGKYLTDGVTWGTTIYLPDGADTSLWHEVDSPPEVDEGEDVLERALEILGVDVYEE